MKLLEYKRLQLIVEWYDGWIGWYYNPKKKVFYFTPLIIIPFLLIRLDFSKKETNDKEVEK